jgi:hypothetical protein
MSLRAFALVVPAAVLMLVASPAAAQDPPSFSLTFLGPADSVNTLSETGVAVGQRTVAGNTRGSRPRPAR